MSSPLRLKAALAAVAGECIWQTGIDSSRVEAFGQARLDSICHRLTGNPGMSSASVWAIAQCKSRLIAVKRENYGT